MQFIADGPDIPETLLQAHEDGRVIFFCGAGVSYPAGLPGFGGLVDRIYADLGTARTAIEQDAYSRGQFDGTLDLLERRLPGGRGAVRKALAKALELSKIPAGATRTHIALLRLSTLRDGALRLVTTNFDRLFQRAARGQRIKLTTYEAPLLPIPKSSRWSGVVHLHGILAEIPSDAALQRLVVTSGDFGLAYLTERWAARFVGELFRNYVVCFVGYSINDPVLRYMMDALAADRRLGEVTPEAYAFGDFSNGQETQKVTEWESKGVKPILYRVPAGSDDHSALHKTLQAWGATYRDGIFGKQNIVGAYALAKPDGSTRQDDFVGRMLWAIADQSGVPARHFAEYNPAPSIDWLDAFSDARYGHDDLIRFGVQANREPDTKLSFSLVHRPSPYNLAPLMQLTAVWPFSAGWDKVMFQLARWLARHVDNPKVVIWLANHGARLHERFKAIIGDQLDRVCRLQAEGKAAELDAIRADSPSGVPRDSMLVLWRLLLADAIKSPWLHLDLYGWVKRLKRDGLTASLRLELRQMLAPKVKVSKPFRYGESEPRNDERERLSDLVDFEMVLEADHPEGPLKTAAREEAWQEALPALLADFEQLLLDALDIQRELGTATDINDRSFLDRPSISDHRQNRDFRDWVLLIQLVRDAWLALKRTAPDRARQAARGWFGRPYPTFKRLALFAARQADSFEPAEWLEWLIIYEAWWLWSIETRRETLRLIVEAGALLTADQAAQLEAAIVLGPPRRMYRDDLTEDHWAATRDHTIWLILAKLQLGRGAFATAQAAERFVAISEANPVWTLRENESDEFAIWSSGTGDPDFEARRTFVITPRTRPDLIEWLRAPSPADMFMYGDDWTDTCRTRFFLSLSALVALAKEGVWPVERWRDALQAWSDGAVVRRAWRFAASVVEAMPDDTFADLARAVSWWLDAVSKSIDCNQGKLVTLAEKVLQAPLEAEDAAGLNDAINHPIGLATSALVNLWFSQEPNDDDRLPENIGALFTQLCDPAVERYRAGRIILASRAIALFRVDRDWAIANLMPLFDWDANEEEALAVWQGFLWSPRLYLPLLDAFKPAFLATAKHCADLADLGRQYAAILTYAALEQLDGFSWAEFEQAVSSLQEEGLTEVARTLAQALEGAGEQRVQYWQNRVRPFWVNAWPKQIELLSPAISEAIATLCAGSGSAFPEVMETVGGWLRPVEHPHYVVHKLSEGNYAELWPAEALRFLDAVVQDQPWPPRELGSLLGRIARAAAQLSNDPRFIRLRDHALAHGFDLV